MPEISDAELRMFVRYQNLGTPDEVTKKLSDLENDNKTQRDEIRELKKVPRVPDGGRIVTKEEAEEIETYRALGKPDDVRAKVAAGEEASQKLADREKRDTLAEAAQVLGWQPNLTARIRGIDAGKIEVREESVTDAEGKTTKAKVPWFTPAGEGQKAVKLADYAGEHDPEIVPLLPAKDQPAGPSRGAPFVPQSPGGRPASGYDPVKAGKDMAAANKAGDNTLAFR